MRTASLLAAPITLALVAVAAPSLAATLTVGQGKTYAKPCDAIAAAQAGDTIEVDAGTYDGDTCAWTTDNLTVKAVGGHAKIDATGTSVTQKKGIFVIYAPNATVEGFELSGAAISSDDGNNGAGIRHQGTNLTVRDCVFHDNQDGILGAPSTDGQGEVLIETSEFRDNGAGDGYSHNMYLNHYAKFTLRGSWSHGAKVGHLVKTRAAENHILYNRITDEAGTASYEIDVPNGGLTFVIGNLIEQGAASQNPSILAYAEEGANALNPKLELFVVNNTFVNDLGSGTFVHVADGSSPAVIQNNAFIGKGTVMATDQASAVLTANFMGADAKLVDQAGYDYHLASDSPCIDGGTAPGMGEGVSLLPTSQYVHPAGLENRTSVGKIDIGAYELGGGGGAGGAGGAGASTSGSGAGPSGSGGAGGADGSGGAGGSGGESSSGDGGRGKTSSGTGGSKSSSGSSSGCAFQGSGAPLEAPLALGLGAALLGLGRRRGRREKGQRRLPA